MRKMTRNGVAPKRKGMRRPHLLRKRSLRKLMIGLIAAAMMLGMVVTMRPRTQLGAPMELSFSGRMLGTTVSMRVKQKSPHRRKRKSVISPAFEYVSVPTLKRLGSAAAGWATVGGEAGTDMKMRKSPRAFSGCVERLARQ